MNTQVNLSPEWRALINKEPEEWDLCNVALLIASQIQPDLEIEPYRQLLANQISGIREAVGDESDINTRIQCLNRYFYEELGYSGDREDYYLPDNSLLNRVIDRRQGIPLTLATIYLKLAESIGLDAYGIGFPGHYLMGVHAEKGEIILDPFNQGATLSNGQLMNMLQQILQKKSDEIDLEKNLQRSSKLDSVVRMLRNLKQIYIEAQKVEEALGCIEMILSLIPEAPDELRDRGMIYQHIEYTQGAISDLNHYLKLVPDANERGVIEALLESLQSQHKQLH